MNLPVKQLSESQSLAAKLQVEQEAKVMQRDLGSQTCLKAVERMGTLTSQPEGIEQLAIDRFDDLTQSGQPASPGFGPTDLAALMRDTDHLRMVQGLPVLMQAIPGEAFVGHIDALCWCTYTAQTRRGKLS